MNQNTTHTIFQVGQKYPSCENGIWVDFKEDTFLFVVKDDVWTSEELGRLKTSDVTVSFIPVSYTHLDVYKRQECCVRCRT